MLSVYAVALYLAFLTVAGIGGYLVAGDMIPGWAVPLAGFVCLAGVIYWKAREVASPSVVADQAAPAESVPAAGSPVSDGELIDILRTSRDRDELEAARAELDARRIRNRAAGISNDSDGLDFLVGFVTGFPVPTTAGIIGAMLHSTGSAAAPRADHFGGAASAIQADIEARADDEERIDTRSADTPSIDNDSGGGDSGGGGSSE